ncbi:ABC transporter ATP-binding protein [Neomegalonema sp.]|uniref:ABC transporter ATP-binding protein n=1 Tax=Neomegalonema sp. TaxID=2039713 RepID=UPI002621AC05|nr:ABC transporter ATP-binding protein [Neomegalonema sp.]MDD2869727.1 ABC transporter ATP-binding protein [Neomegalonema sp.]
MTSLEIRKIDKFYGVHQALFDVSLSIGKGEFVTLLGPSGSGKTTLLKILAGFETVSGGEITLDGRNITELKPEARNFGLVFQGYALFPHMTVRENIAYPLKVRRMPRDAVATRVREMLDLVQLARFIDRKPSELSGGQQQRVALARALAFRPDVLLLDEPMSALDKKLRVDLQEELRQIHQTLGTTFINVTHDQEEAMHMSDRIAVMNHGRIEQFDTAFALYRHPGARFVAEFIGKSNIFPGELTREDGGSAIFRAEGMEMRLDAGSRTPGAADLMVRPEDVLLGTAPAAGRVNLPAEVLGSTYSGDRALYALKLASGRALSAYGAARSGVHPEGAQVFASFSPEDATLIG